MSTPNRYMAMDETVATADSSPSQQPPTPPSERPMPRKSEDLEMSSNSEFSKEDNRRNLAPGYVPMRKSTLAFLGFLLIAFLVLFSYFVSMWHLERTKEAELTRDIPQGNEDCVIQNQLECEFNSDDVDQLQLEIDRLEDANELLSDQLEVYANLTNRLNASIIELERQNGILADSNDEYAELNDRLNASLAELQEQNEFLEEQVDRFEELNQNLNATVGNLEDQVDRLEDEVDELTFQNDRLEELVGSLNNETDRLEELGDMLQADVDRLEEHVDELAAENDRLDGLLGDLETVTSYLNETAENLDETYEELASFLAEQITTNRQLVIETVENTFHQRVSNWDCALRDEFALEDFADDGNLKIPDNKYGAVITFVEERVLSDLCLNTQDFTDFLDARYANLDMTTNRLVTGVQRYTWNALDYYFPEGNEAGLTPEDWADAAYDCDNLPANKRFEFVVEP